MLSTRTEEVLQVLCPSATWKSLLKEEPSLNPELK